MSKIHNENYLIKKTFFSLFKVFLFTEFANSIGCIVDSIIVGQLLQPEYLSAVNITKPFFTIVHAMVAVLATGGVLLYTNYSGKNETDKGNQIFTLVIQGSFVLGILATIIPYIFSTPLINIMGGEKGTELYQISQVYLMGRSFGIIPYMLSYSLMWMLKVQNGNKYTIVATIVITVSNIIMDILVIKYLHLGMFGVGIATALSYLFSVLVCGTFFLSKKNSFRFSKISNIKQELLKIIKYGSASGFVRISCAIGICLINNILFKTIGLDAVTSYTVWLNVSDFIGRIAMIGSISIAPMIALFAGERDKAQIRKTFHYAIRFEYIIIPILAIITFISAEYIPLIFGIGKTSSCYTEVVRALRYFAVFLIPNVAVVFLTDYYNAVQNVILSNVMIAMKNILIICPCLILLSQFGGNGVWASFVITEVLILIIIFTYIWFKQRKLPTTDDILFYKTNFDIPKDMLYTLSIKNSIEDVIGVSKNIQDFCMERGIGKKYSTYVALSIEEMACNVVKHSFENNKEHFIDIRVIIKDNKVIICIRNDGHPFNTVNYYKHLIKDDITANVGIRLVMAITEDVKYHYVMGINHLVLVCGLNK